MSASQTISVSAAQLEATLGLRMWLSGKAFAQHAQDPGSTSSTKG